MKSMFFLFRVKGIFLFLITKKKKYPLKLRCSRNNNNALLRTCSANCASHKIVQNFRQSLASSPMKSANRHLSNREVLSFYRKVCPFALQKKRLLYLSHKTRRLNLKSQLLIAIFIKKRKLCGCKAKLNIRIFAVASCIQWIA